jgi:hypothetical protein
MGRMGPIQWKSPLLQYAGLSQQTPFDKAFRDKTHAEHNLALLIKR